MKDIYVVGKTMAGNGCKMAKYKSCQFFFRTDFRAHSDVYAIFKQLHLALEYKMCFGGVFGQNQDYLLASCTFS